MTKYYIYKITNNINHKTYIGQHLYHGSLLVEDGYMGSGIILKKAQKKYGIENFSKEIVTIAMSRSEANVLEKFYISKERNENSYGCYNVADGGQGGAWNKGIPCSEESKKKISEALKGREHSEEWKRKINENSTKFSGHHHSEESRKKISESEKGHRPYFCRPRTKEEKRKISEKLKGRKLNLSDEERLARSEKAKEMSRRNIGSKRSEETKKKMSEALKAYWAKKRGEL